MDWIKTINTAISYMEEHLNEDVKLNDIAEQVSISPFHFQRAFTLIAGMSPAEYMRGRRLSKAGAELAGGECQVIEAALRYGYDSPESFAKAFSRFHGFSPIQVKNGKPARFMNRYAVRLVIDGGSIMEYRIEKWEDIDLLLHVEGFKTEESETAIPLIWDNYYKNSDCRKIIGTIGACKELNPDGSISVYGIGCRASECEGVPTGFEAVSIPSCTWAVFKCTGPATESLKEMWHRIYREWIPSVEYELADDCYLEILPLGDTLAQDYVCELCIPVKNR